MTKFIDAGKFTIYGGFSKFTSFGIGFHVDKWSFSAELGPLWFGVEW